MDELSAEQAADVHRELVLRQIHKLNKLPRYIQIELWADGSADLPFYQSIFQRWPRLRYRKQCSGDLGKRLDLGLKKGLTHANIVVQIGSDCPELDLPHIQHACQLLLHHNGAAFVPAEDGGYVLGAYTLRQSLMFRDISWGSEHVLNQCIARLNRLNVVPVLFDPLWDVDRPDDFFRYQQLCKIEDGL